MGLLDFLKKIRHGLSSEDIDSVYGSTSGKQVIKKDIDPASQPIPEGEKMYYRPDDYYTDNVLSSSVVSFEDRKKSCIPSQRGLYVAEILLLQYCSYGTYPHPKNGYPGFWWFEYGIRNVDAVLASLADRGFIQKVSAVDSLHRLTVPQLKEILTAHELPKTGKKADLIERLRNNVCFEELENAIKERKYALTALGEAELDDNAYVPYMHRHPHKMLIEDLSNPKSFNVWVINKLLGTGDKRNWKSVCDEREGKLDSSPAAHTTAMYSSLRQSNASLAKALAAQDAQLERINEAEAAYSSTGDIDALIAFWERLWVRGGLLFNGAGWAFRLADLYMKQGRYDDALRFVKGIRDPSYQYKVDRYIARIEKQLR